MTVHPAPEPVPDAVSTTPGRALGAAEIAVGLVTIARSRRIATAGWWRLDRRLMALVVVVLGVRQLVQGAVTVVRPGRTTLLGGAGVDALHAATMLPVAVAGGPYRRAATVSTVLALAGAATATVLARLEREQWV